MPGARAKKSTPASGSGSSSNTSTPRKRGRPSAASKKAEEPKSKKQKVTHTSYFSAQGLVLALGEGDVGQLGLGENILEKSKPGFVEVVGKDIIQVVAGGMHTACLTANGEVWTFGCNDEFALGRVTSKEGSETHPGKVALDGKIVQISAGDSHTAALCDNGRVLAWGTFRDANGSIGLTASGEREPKPIEFLKDLTVIKITSGNDHLVCLTDEGDIYTAGCAEQGQLGRVAECFSQRGGRKGVSFLLNPAVVNVKKVHGKRAQFTDVWAGSYHTFAQTKDKDIYAWGLNNYHQLGIPDMENKFMPEIAKCFANNGLGWQAIEGGQHHSIALDGNGKVYAMGRPEYGRLGVAEVKEDLKVPTVIPTLQGIRCVGISCGSAVSLSVSEDGKVYGWGMSTSQQTGHGDDEDILVPTIMPGKQLQNRKALMVSGGGQHTVILAKDAVPNGDAQS